MPVLNRDKGATLVLFLMGLLFFAQHLNVHGLEYRDDEILYYKSTQEMINTGDTLAPKYFGEDRSQQPILFYWFILYAYKFLGINWVAARFPSVVFAAWVLSLTWSLARRSTLGRPLAFLSALVLSTTPMFFRHAKDAVPDMTLNFFIVLALWTAYEFIQNPKRKILSLLFFISCALGFMVKGSPAIVIPLLTVFIYLITTRELKKILQLPWLPGIVLMTLIIAPWFVYTRISHGQAYIDFMWIQDIQRRLFSEGEAQRIVLSMIKNFGHNILVYLKALLFYFAPWCIFMLGAFPMIFTRILKNHDDKKLLSFFLTWFFVVFVFLLFIPVAVNHYLLVLSTPFSILISYFILAGLKQEEGAAKAFLIYAFMLFLSIGFLGLLFFHLGLAGGESLWLLVYLAGFVAMALFIVQKPTWAPFVFGLFMVAVFSQTPLMVKAGVSTHATLQKFADTITSDLPANAIISVGSHDLHAEELQVYFEQKIASPAVREDDAQANLLKLMSTQQPMYCLILDKDYQALAPQFADRHFKVVQEDYIFRRRMQLDSNFFFAIMNLDHGQIRTYLKEKILLLKREPKV